MPLLRRLDPERAHRLALAALRMGLAGRDHAPPDPALQTQALGLRFPHPIGLAAGFDKDARALRPLMRLGFGFVEAGTVTPRAQPGNPRPRLFRLAEDAAVINRMGFNNAGLVAFRRQLAAMREHPVPVGVNIGINKEGADPERDYPAMVAALAPLADYIVLNVSSPNTPGLRELQEARRLGAILAAINDAVPARPALLVKLAPDLGEAALTAIIDTALAARVEGLILTNTTRARPATLRSPHAAEAGGLSGPPLAAAASAMLRAAARQAAGRLTLIGVGGIASGADVLARLRAGASLVQVYTAFAYAGPALLPRLRRELAAELRAQGFATIREAIGADLR